MKNRDMDIILSQVEKPSRYIGGEVNAIKKDRAHCALSVALAFPDAYEVGMSHLGIQILYAILNNQPEIAAERFFCPWPDMERLMRSRNVPLLSLESRTPLNEFDIVGFSLQYELSYTNVLNMLELGGIPLYAEDREEESPIVIAGGPSAFNPEPVSLFFDAFVIGEGEDVIREISRAVINGKGRGDTRKNLLASLASIDGVWVPSVQVNGERIRKRIVADMNRWTLPGTPVVPLMKTIHDRATLEIARGCSRGCRFCQAGMVWRPVRERTPNTLEKMARDMLTSTGYDELSFLSLSSGDYSRIEHLLTSCMDRYYEKKIALALPSMRVETLTETLIKQIKRVRKTSFTLAPEAGTQRLRNIINKGNTEANLLDTTRRVFQAGWQSVKLYFMLGLPTETKEDLEGIVDLAYKVLREGGKRKRVTVSLSTFVPKPHTPFQWTRQIGLEEIENKQAFFKENLRHKNISLKWHDGRMSLLEGLLSRGDRKIGAVVAKAFALGCRFDGWSDRFRFDLWEQAIGESNIDVDEYLAEKDLKSALPWNHIDCGLSKDFLIGEYKKSLTETLTEDCRFGICHNCGVCDEDYRIILAKDDTEEEAAAPETDTHMENLSGEERKIRITVAKQWDARLLSHLEISAAIIRAITRSALRFVFSEGFHPHPKISFAFATPVGTESACELVDIRIKAPFGNRKEYIDTINASLPSGLEITGMEEIPLDAPSLAKLIEGYHYKMYLPGELTEADRVTVEEKIRDFLDGGVFTVTRKRKGKMTTKNIRPFIGTLSFNRAELVIDMSSRFGTNGGVNPLTILTNVLALDDATAKTTRIIKTAPIFSDREKNHG